MKDLERQITFKKEYIYVINRGTDKLRICIFYALKCQILIFVFKFSVKCERIDLFMFTFSVGLFPHFL